MERRNAGETTCTTYTGSPLITAYGYDPVGNLDTVTQPNGVTEDYDYDSLNRLYHVYVHYGEDAIFEQTYVIASDGQRDSVIEKRYNGSGHAASDVLSNVQITWDYDADGRLIAETRDADTTPGDGNDDFDDRDTANGTSVIVDDYTDFFTLDLVGNRNRLLHGWDADGDGIADAGEVDSDTLYLYNSRDQLLSEDSLDASLGSATAAVNGQAVTITVTNTLVAGDFVYIEGYDGVFAVQSPTSGSFTISTGDISITPGAVVVHKVLAPTTYAYDANGSQATVATPAGTTHYLWDLRGRIVGMTDGSTTTTIGYDHSGQRISEQTGTAPTTYYLNDAANPTGYTKAIEERVDTDADGQADATVRTFTFGLTVLSQTNAAVDPDPAVTIYLITDGHGSTRLVTDDAGVTVERYDYTAFGQPIGFIASDALTDWQFGGDGIYDGATGWTYHLARWRSDFRFVSYDSVEADPASPAGLHKYLYANANPNYYSDPSGNMSFAEVNLAVGGLMTGQSMVNFAVNPTLANAGWLALNVVTMPLGWAKTLKALWGAGKAASVGRGMVSLLVGTKTISEIRALNWLAKMGVTVLAEEQTLIKIIQGLKQAGRWGGPAGRVVDYVAEMAGGAKLLFAEAKPVLRLADMTTECIEKFRNSIGAMKAAAQLAGETFPGVGKLVITCERVQKVVGFNTYEVASDGRLLKDGAAVVIDGIEIVVKTMF